MKIFETISNVHSIRIGNDDFTILLPNEYGDCKNHVIIINSYDVDEYRIKRNYDFSCSFRVGENKDVFIYNIDYENCNRVKMDSGYDDIYRHIDYCDDDCTFIFLKKRNLNEKRYTLW